MQDIKTAPKDGTWVVVRFNGVYLEAHYYCGFLEDRSGNQLINPTHRCHIPVPKEPMTKEQLLKSISLGDKYDAAYNADIADLLIEYINDDEITEAYEKF
jgi:hypothetical protein